jgi:hypothetical protein
LTGSKPFTKTIGIVEVAALAAGAAGGPPAKITATFTADQIGRQCWQSIVFTFRPAIFDACVLAFNKTCFAQPLTESDDEVLIRPK